MSYDDADQPSEPVLSLGEAALLSVFAKLFKDHVIPAIDDKIAAVKGPLLSAYNDPDNGSKSIDAKVNGVAVATHTVAVSKDKYVVGDEDAFTEFADSKGEVEGIIRVRPAFEDAMLKRVTFDKETGEIVDKYTGEVVPGITRIPGGTATGSVSLRWKDGGKDAVMEAFHKRELDALLRGVPMLPAPPARDPQQ